MFDDKQLKILNSELNSSRVKTRDKGNINLSYLEGFDIIETANTIFGFGNWSYNTKLEKISQEVNQNQNHVISYKALVEVRVYNPTHTLSISREDVGFGSGISSSLADAYEGAVKEAVTDGLKRALRSFGNQFGNSLYSKGKSNSNRNQTTPQTHHINNSPQNNSYQTPYTNQQDFSTLTNVGLQVIQQGNILVVTGEGIFEKKDIIKSTGFRWDGQAKQWYMQLRQAA